MFYYPQEAKSRPLSPLIEESNGREGKRKNRALGRRRDNDGEGNRKDRALGRRRRGNGKRVQRQRRGGDMEKAIKGEDLSDSSSPNQS